MSRAILSPQSPTQTPCLPNSGPRGCRWRFRGYHDDEAEGCLFFMPPLECCWVCRRLRKVEGREAERLVNEEERSERAREIEEFHDVSWRFLEFLQDPAPPPAPPAAEPESAAASAASADPAAPPAPALPAPAAPAAAAPWQKLIEIVHVPCTLSLPGPHLDTTSTSILQVGSTQQACDFLCLPCP